MSDRDFRPGIYTMDALDETTDGEEMFDRELPEGPLPVRGQRRPPSESVL